MRWRPGVVAALPVAAMLGLGTAIGQPRGAVSMGAGAMLVGVAWRAGNGPDSPPLATMGAAALAVVFSTLVGTLTGRWPWLHLVVLSGLCLVAGLGTSLGRRGTVVGVQTLIAFIIFGRFAESLTGALRLAGLVAAGAFVQIIFAALVAAPLAWRRQRRALAAAYRGLADLAGPGTRTGVPAAQLLDAAESVLDAPALFGDPQLASLLSLVSEGRRIRLELLVLGATQADPTVGPALARLTSLLKAIALTLEVANTTAAARLEAEAADLGRWAAERSRLAAPATERRLAALGGQLRAAARLAAAVAWEGDRGGHLPHPQSGARLSRRFVADVVRLSESTDLRSVAGRHAVRLSVVVAGTELLSQRLSLPRGYWAVVAAATVLRPNYGDTFTRGAERMLGTLVGVVLATLIAVAVDPSGYGIVATVGCIALATFAVFPASFAAGTVGLTAMIVFLLHPVSAASVTLAFDRGIDTVLGGTIALLAYVVWPTWSASALPTELRRLIGAQGRYLTTVLAGVRTGSPVHATSLAASARQVRMAYADAEASLEVARGEPTRHAGLAPQLAAAELAALRRVTLAIHAIRLSQAEFVAVPPEIDLEPLSAALAEALGMLAERLAAPGGAPDLPPLRDRYREVAGALPDALGHALDELVDSVNSAGAVLDR